MTDGFTLYLADLLAHASTLDEQAERIGTARAAAAQAKPGPDNFGFIGQVFAIGAIDQVRVAQGCLDGLRDAVSQLGGGVRDTADVYDQVDRANRTILEGIR